MAKGRIKNYFHQGRPTLSGGKNFGFIKRPDGPDVYVRRRELEHSGLIDRFEEEDLEGLEVTFDIQETPKGPQAVNVRSVDLEAEREAERRAQKQKEEADKAHLREKLEALRPLIEPHLPLTRGEPVDLGNGFVVSHSYDSVEIGELDSESGVTVRYKQTVHVRYRKAYELLEFEVTRTGWDDVALETTSHYHKPDREAQTLTVQFRVAGRQLRTAEFPATAELPFRKGDEVKQVVTAQTPVGEARRVLQLYPQETSQEEAWSEFSHLVAEIEAERSAEEQALAEEIATNKQLGLLSVDPANIWYFLQGKECPGIGWAGWAATSPAVIHPALKPIFEGTNTELEPLVMAAGVPKGEEPWLIEWQFGRDPDPQKIAAILATEEVVEPLPGSKVEDWLMAQDEIPAQISMSEPYEGCYASIQFDATIEVPHKVLAVRWVGEREGDRVVVDERRELFPILVEGIAYGNEPYQGEAVIVPQARRKGRNNQGWRISFAWEPPKTAEELAAEEMKRLKYLHKVAVEWDARLSGWRYHDTGNPLILVNVENQGWWVIRELDRQTMDVDKRKGSGSNTYVRNLHPQTIREALEKYEGFGWPVERDPDLKPGKRLTEVLGLEEVEDAS